MEFDPRKASFFDRQAVDRELRRVYDICHGCRLCFKLCPSFPSLFDSLDTPEVDGETDRLTPEQMGRVVDLCFGCKLCFEKCPYTPPHRFDLDFPRLMLRARAAEAREHGVSLQSRVLGDPDRLGKLAGLVTPLANWANRNPVSRLLLEKSVGIDRRRHLPVFQSQSFESWFRSRARPGAAQAGAAKVAIFATCSVNYNFPEVGRALVRVLERNGIQVSVPAQHCCGMPALDGGDVEAAMRAADANVASLVEAVRAGADVVSPGPTCSYVLKKDLVDLARDKQAAREIAGHTFDACEYLWRRHEDGKLDTRFARAPSRIAYQLPCHLKVQNMGALSRDLLRLLPEVEVRLIERCSGMDGTWGMKRKYFDLSLEVAAPLIQEIGQSEPELVVTDCLMSAVQIEQATGSRPLHPIEVLDRAYSGETDS